MQLQIISPSDNQWRRSESIW